MLEQTSSDTNQTKIERPSVAQLLRVGASALAITLLVANPFGDQQPVAIAQPFVQPPAAAGVAQSLFGMENLPTSPEDASIYEPIVEGDINQMSYQLLTPATEGINLAVRFTNPPAELARVEITSNNYPNSDNDVLPYESHPITQTNGDLFIRDGNTFTVTYSLPYSIPLGQQTSRYDGKVNFYNAAGEQIWGMGFPAFPLRPIIKPGDEVTCTPTAMPEGTPIYCQAVIGGSTSRSTLGGPNVGQWTIGDRLITETSHPDYIRVVKPANGMLPVQVILSNPDGTSILRTGNTENGPEELSKLFLPLMGK